MIQQSNNRKPGWEHLPNATTTPTKDRCASNRLSGLSDSPDRLWPCRARYSCGSASGRIHLSSAILFLML